ncbi:hypothetical protein Chor_004525 [Crotalus horridus]
MAGSVFVLHFPFQLVRKVASPKQLDQDASSRQPRSWWNAWELHEYLSEGRNPRLVEGKLIQSISEMCQILLVLELRKFPGRALQRNSFWIVAGVSLTAQRAAVVVGVELPVYDLTKKHIILSGYMGDTVYTHLL